MSLNDCVRYNAKKQMFAHVLDMTCNDHASSAVWLNAAGVTTHVAACF